MYIPAIALTIALALPGVAAFAAPAAVPDTQAVVQQHDHQADAKGCCAGKKDAGACCTNGQGCGDCCKDGTCAMGCCENGDCSKCTMKEGDQPAKGACCKNGPAPKADQAKGCCGK